MPDDSPVVPFTPTMARASVKAENERRERKAHELAIRPFEQHELRRINNRLHLAVANHLSGASEHFVVELETPARIARVRIDYPDWVFRMEDRSLWVIIE